MEYSKIPTVYLLIMLMLTLVTGCMSSVRVILAGRQSITNINGDSVVTFYFCSIKQQAGCDPLSGESLILARVGENYEGTIDIASSTLQSNAGDSDGIGAVNFH